MILVCTPDSLAVGLARVGQDDQLICFGTLKELRDVDFGAPLHSLILCSPELHELELEMLNYFSVKNLHKEFIVCQTNSIRNHFMCIIQSSILKQPFWKRSTIRKYSNGVEFAEEGMLQHL